jgi:hypothetical protein
MSGQDHAPSIVPADEGQLLEVIAHLGAALMQADFTDDPIIIGHIRSAHTIATAIHRAPVREATNAQV